MYEQVEKTPEQKSPIVTNSVSHMQNSNAPISSFVDNRPEAIQMRKLRDLAKHSPLNKKLRDLRNLAAAHSVAQKKSYEKQDFGFVDNRPDKYERRKLQNMVNNGNQVKQAAKVKPSVNKKYTQQIPRMKKLGKSDIAPDAREYSELPLQHEEGVAPKLEIGSKIKIDDSENLPSTPQRAQTKIETVSQNENALEPIQRAKLKVGAEDARTAGGAYIWHPRWVDKVYEPIKGVFDQATYDAMPTATKGEKKQKKEYKKRTHAEREITVMSWGVKAMSRNGSNQWVYFQDRNTGRTHYDTGRANHPTISNEQMRNRLPVGLRGYWNEFVLAIL